jgi:hypothetical protein
MRTYINREDTNKGLCDPTNKLLRFFLLSFSSWEKEREGGEGERFGREQSREREKKSSQSLSTQKHRKAFFGFD